MSRHARHLRAAAVVAALTTASTGAALAVSPAQAAKAPGASSATGTVFYPNPVQSTGNEALVDNDDADSPDFASAYRQVTLTNLDGSGYLSGPYVTVKSSTGPAAQVVNGAVPAYHRDDDRFEQVMGYYWVNRAQAYLQSLGFGSGSLPPVNQRQIELRINQSGHDNSFFRQDQANITLGKGGVDDGEDAEVIVHEYGHSVQDSQVPGFGSSPEAGAMGEGFGDYLAVAVTSWQTGRPTLTPEACVADWDSTSYTRTVPHCLRRLDGNKHYPEDVVGEVHADGEIWSRALWDIRQALGDTKATTTIVDAQFDLTADTTFATAARTTVATADRLYGGAAADAVTAAFKARGIL